MSSFDTGYRACIGRRVYFFKYADEMDKAQDIFYRSNTDSNDIFEEEINNRNFTWCYYNTSP